MEWLLTNDICLIVFINFWLGAGGPLGWGDL